MKSSLELGRQHGLPPGYERSYSYCVVSIYCASISVMSNLLIYNNYQIILSQNTPTLVTIFGSTHNILQQAIISYVSLLENHIPFAQSFVSPLSLDFPSRAGFSLHVSLTMTSCEERVRSQDG